MNAQVATLLKDQVSKDFSLHIFIRPLPAATGSRIWMDSDWFTVQAHEEKEYALTILNYLQDNGADVTLGIIEAPFADFGNSRKSLVVTLNHERHITGRIHTIYKQARDTDDFRTCQFMEWFIAEQGEEEKTSPISWPASISSATMHESCIF